jgi:hypothetical protein
MGRAPGAARRNPEGTGGACAQTRRRTARHVERRAGIPVAAYRGIGISLASIGPDFFELPPSRSGDGGKVLPRGRDGVGRERGYPLGARGWSARRRLRGWLRPAPTSPILRRSLHRSAKRRLSPPGDLIGIRRTVLRNCHAHLTRCRNERKRGRRDTGSIARSRPSRTPAWSSRRR